MTQTTSSFPPLQAPSVYSATHYAANPIVPLSIIDWDISNTKYMPSAHYSVVGLRSDLLPSRPIHKLENQKDIPTNHGLFFDNFIMLCVISCVALPAPF